MADLPAVIAEVASGVANIVLEANRERLGSGSAFLVDGGLVTADHVVTANYDTARIRFDGDDPGAGIKLTRADLQSRIRYRSPENELDLAILSLDEPEFEGRHRFELEGTVPPSGTQIVVMGYPYETPHLSSHVGYVSATYKRLGTQVLQLDASVNPSNSGGCVIDPETLSVVAYVTRAQTGLTADFNDLLRAFEQNIVELSKSRASISIGGIDPVEGLKVTMAAMQRLGVNLRRSANVGIGYAFGAQYILENS